MSLGEDRVRTKFNPSADSLVDQIKKKSAELIDLVETINSHVANVSDGQRVVEIETKEIARLKALAQTHYEDAAMWAVKAATADK